jgi:hypothetical protein
VRLYHETRSKGDMFAILRDGFRDSDPIAPSPDFPSGLHGVWLSDSATATAATGGSGHRLVVDVPDDIASRYVVPCSPGEVLGRWREFCIPAEIVNRYRSGWIDGRLAGGSRCVDGVVRTHQKRAS